MGRTELYLLDTDHDLNQNEDRSITYHLYGGDWENRLKQEMLLGIGGIRALNAMGIRQDVYHCNEGHAAFTGIERIRNLIHNDKLSFSEALEVVRSSSLFTTHTPVPAGHDAFPESMIRQYMSHYPDRLEITWDQFINLGKTNPNDPNEKFSMSFLACNLSQEVNGVSWLHGEVGKEILGGMWPGYFKDDYHIGYVTNGVHFPTWCAANLKRLYAKYFGEGFRNKDYRIAAWQKVHNITDRELWDARLVLKNKLIDHIRKRVSDPKQFRFDSPRQMIRIQESLRPDVLTIGFARRFATYKRANLLHEPRPARQHREQSRAARAVHFSRQGSPERQAGSGPHQADRRGGRHASVYGQDHLPAELRHGTGPTHGAGRRRMAQHAHAPLEASGTSGEKAVMNGVLQFSVLDGWWVEGYKKGGGWMLPMERTFENQDFQNEMDAELIHNTIEEEIAPLYYRRDENNVPHDWVESIKVCVRPISRPTRSKPDAQRLRGTLLPQAARTSRTDGRRGFPDGARDRGMEAPRQQRMGQGARREHRAVQHGQGSRLIGHGYDVEVVVDIDGLRPEDIGVEMILADQITDNKNVRVIAKRELTFVRQDGSRAFYSVRSTPESTGSFDMAIRVFPKNDKLPHRMDFALVKWA